MLLASEIALIVDLFGLSRIEVARRVDDRGQP
jgi:hypothetical protein